MGPRTLETPSHGIPPRNKSVHRSQEPRILPPPTANQLEGGPIHSKTGGLPLSTDPQTRNTEPRRLPLQTTRPHKRRRRQHQCHSSHPRSVCQCGFIHPHRRQSHGTTTTTPRHPRRMGGALPAHEIRKVLVERHKTSSCGQHCVKEGGNFPISQSKDSWTPRNHENDLAGITRLLVARHETGHLRLCARLHHMPSKQKFSWKPKATIIPHQDKGERPPL